MKKAFEPFVNPDSRILILGTMPSEKSLVFGQYYGNTQNHFWKIVYAIFGCDFEQEYSKRLSFLAQRGIALWDVLAQCERVGSLDSKIKNESPQPIAALLKQYPAIKTIAFSSQKAAWYFDKYIGRQAGLKYVILPSPSGANARMSLNEKIEQWKILTQL